MNDRNHISAVLISFNGISFIADCLKTLKEDLRGFEYEIIVVDNHSTDGTAEYIEGNHPDVNLIKNDSNRGFAAAVNQGIRTARYELLWILNQDIRIRPGCLRALMQCRDNLTAPGVVGPRFIGFDGILQRSCRRLPRYRYMWFEMTGLAYVFPRSEIFNGWKMGEFDHETSCSVEQPMGAAMLISRECVDRVGLIDESFPIFMNDVDFCRRILDAGYTNYYCADAVMEHYVGGSTSRRKAVMVWHSHLSMFRYFRKWEKKRGSPGKKLLYLPALYITGSGLLVTACLRSAYYILKPST